MWSTPFLIKLNSDYNSEGKLLSEKQIINKYKANLSEKKYNFWRLVFRVGNKEFVSKMSPADFYNALAVLELEDERRKQ